jgi:NAD(P)-dependent dehydrogenase (short-subunit alcohol dehydrogenase family)
VAQHFERPSSVDVSDKTIVITGGSSGIGAAAAKALRERGARVVITGRSPETTRIANELGCDAYFVDYASFADVRRLADRLLLAYPRIDVLANNAGSLFGQRHVTEDGHEMTLQVNHLSGFLLTTLLRERLEASGGVVINTASQAHLTAPLKFDDLESEHYASFRAYGMSKLMNILHAREINRRFTNVSAVSFHPGALATGFARNSGAVMRWFFGSAIGRLLLGPATRGGDRLAWLASHQPGTDWMPGEYYDGSHPGRKSAHVTADNARHLWEASETLIDTRR